MTVRFALDLPHMISNRKARNRRAIEIKAPEPATVIEQELARIMVQVVRAWVEAVRDRILPAYAGAIEQAKPVVLDVALADDVRDLRSEMDSSDEGVYRLILNIDQRLKDWSVRAELVHRNRFTSSAKVATGVDLSTIITAEGVSETLAAVYERNLSLIKNIADETRGKIGDIVFRNFQQRTPRREVAKQIAEATGLARDRALRIASDQSTKLSATLDQERQEELGIKKFRWIHSGKVHFRPEHKARDGKIFSWSKNNLNGDLPGVAINCGCKAQAHIDLE